MSAPSQFSGVTVHTKANVYFDGGVVSHTVLFADGTKKTLGLTRPGNYHFGTGAPERMEILAGDLDVLLPGETNWRAVAGGESFDVPGNAKFRLRVRALADYCCSFLP